MRLIAFPEPHPRAPWTEQYRGHVSVTFPEDCPLHYEDHPEITKVRPEVAEWLEQNLAGRYRMLSLRNPAAVPGIDFYDYPSALAFRLRWQGVTDFEDAGT